ncbi:MAG: hypothetical protein WA754_17650, partial [Pseudolabrys sp.]
QCMILLRQHESDFEKEGILIHESLEYWINAAQDIQTIFSNRDARRGLQGDIAFGHLTICVAFKANGASLYLRPENTQAALNYHAAQMIAGGDNISDLQKLRYVVLRWRCGTREDQKASRSAFLQR